MKAFLSYPSENLDDAREVYTFLRGIGVDVWFDKESLVGGDDWARTIKFALRSSDLVILVCSAAVISKAGVIQREIRDALEAMRDKPLGSNFLLPLRTADIRLPLELTEMQYVDFFRPGWQIALARSVRRRFEQLEEAFPASLLDYFDTYERAGGIEFRTLRRGFSGFEADADYFTYRTGGEYWDFIAAEITSDIIGGFYEANAFATAQARQMKKVGFEPHMGMSWSRRAEEYFREGEFVSLQFDAWQFFMGAHGTRGVYTKNYGGRQLGAITLRELLGTKAEALEVLLSHSKQEMTRIFESDDDGEQHHFEHMFGNFAEAWEPFSQWLFNRYGVRLWFSMYSGFPYAAGVFDVTAPWSILKPYIAEDYRDTPFGAFIASR